MGVSYELRLNVQCRQAHVTLMGGVLWLACTEPYLCSSPNQFMPPFPRRQRERLYALVLFQRWNRVTVAGSVIMAGSGRVSGQSYIWTDPVLRPGSRQNNRLIHCIQLLVLCVVPLAPSKRAPLIASQLLLPPSVHLPCKACCAMLLSSNNPLPTSWSEETQS